MVTPRNLDGFEANRLQPSKIARRKADLQRFETPQPLSKSLYCGTPAEWKNIKTLIELTELNIRLCVLLEARSK